MGEIWIFKTKIMFSMPKWTNRDQLSHLVDNPFKVPYVIGRTYTDIVTYWIGPAKV